ncbi:flavodoxin domain-containing protein, partial [Staphylococcus aureus]
SGYLLAVDNDDATTGSELEQTVEEIEGNNNHLSEQQLTSASYMLQNKEPHIQASQRHVTVLYGSESGNAMGLAEIFSERLNEIGHQVSLMSMDDYD